MLAIALIFDLIFFGVLLTYFFKLRFFFEERVIVGLLLGTILLGFTVLFLSYFFGLGVLSLSLFLIILNIIGVWMLKKTDGSIIKNEASNFLIRLKKQWTRFFIILSIFLFLYSYIVSQLFIFYNNSYYVKPVHAYGDISLHLGIISSFAYGDNFPVKNPILSDAPISYPFLFDFTTAIFVNPLGLSLNQAITLTGVLGIVAVIVILTYFSLTVTGSKLASLLVLVLFLFNGGLGFLYFFEDLSKSGVNLLQFIANIQKDYTALKDLGFWWINVVISMLLPQRGFLLGFPVSILILRLFWELSEIFETRKLILAFIMLSLMPLIHTHSSIALLPFILYFIFLIIRQNFKSIKYILPLSILSFTTAFLLSRLFLQQSHNILDLMSIKLGWIADGKNILPFYFKNFGLVLVLIPIFLIIGIKKKLKLAVFTLIGQIWFILPSFILFQPWDFDNTKLFIYWYFASILLISFMLSRIIQKERLKGLILSFCIIFLVCFSGFLDNIRLILSSGVRYEVYSKKDIEVAEFIKNSTPKKSVFLSIDKFNNPAVSLAGRKVVVGYHGWLWTYGLNYSERDKDIKKMLSGNADKELFEKYDINYAIFFDEQNDFEINIDYFDKNYDLIYVKDGYRIYKI